MSNNSDHDVPFILPDDDDDSDIFSSAPASSLGEEEDAIFSSVSTPPVEKRSTTLSGGYGAISAPPARHKVVIGGDATPQTGGFPAVPQTGGFPSVQIGGSAGARLEVLDDLNAISQDFILHEGRNILGNGSNVDIALGDPFISKWHTALTLQRGTLMLEDLSSINGVYLGIADAFTLEDGDEVVMGEQRFIYRASAPMPELQRPFGRHPEPMGMPIPADYPHLIQVMEGGFIGGLYPIHDLLVIGRSRGDVRCPNDPHLEDEHAHIERRGRIFHIHDRQTLHGTYIRVNDAVELIPGDCFVAGRTRLRVQF